MIYIYVQVKYSKKGSIGAIFSLFSAVSLRIKEQRHGQRHYICTKLRACLYCYICTITKGIAPTNYFCSTMVHTFINFTHKKSSQETPDCFYINCINYNADNLL